MRAERRRSWPSLVPALALAATLLGACSSADEAEPAAAPQARATASETPEPAPPRRYVALGDSFTAAPYVPDTDLAGGCFRSSGNYPSLVAQEIGATLVDVSCGGARTDDLVDEQSFAFTENTIPPQLDAVTRRADLVTLGIGGNDGDLFQTLVHECTRVSGIPGTSCEDLVSTRQGGVERAVTHIGRQVTRSLRKVRDRAPEAEVVLVGYPRLVDEDAGCARMPLTRADRRFLARVEASLRDAMAAAARRTGAEFVDMHAASEGHEICSDDPWVNGRRTDESRALAYHPFASGQRAVAERILELLR